MQQSWWKLTAKLYILYAQASTFLLSMNLL